MQRKEFVRTSAFSALLALSSKNLFASFADPVYKVTMLTSNIGIFTEKGGTIAFLLSDDGIVVVDSEFPEQANHLIIFSFKVAIPVQFELITPVIIFC